VWRNSCYSWPRLVCSQRGETEVRLPLGPWRASTSPASGHAVGTVRLQSAARSRRDKISLARSRRVAARRDEISLKRGSETAQALTGGRRHVQEGVLSSRRLRDRGTSKSENPGDPVSCSCVARARAGTGHSAASAASHAPSRFCTFAAARRSPQPRPVRQNVRDRTPRVTEPRDSARAHVVDLSFEVRLPGPFGRTLCHVTARRHPTRRGPRSGTRARRLRTPGVASALVARRRPVCAACVS
jgi:hypothetical protein